MRRFLLILSVLVLSATVAACAEVDPIGGGEGETQPGATTQPAPDDTGAAEEAADDVEVEEEDVDAEGVRTIDFEEPFVSDGPATLRVLAIRFMTREHAADQAAELESFLDDSTQTIVSLKVEASNESESPFDWYPNQGQLVIGNEQIDAALFISDDVGGDNWQPGVLREGSIHWESRQSFQDLEGAGEARVLVSAPFSSEDFEQAGDDTDLQITWQP